MRNDAPYCSVFWLCRRAVVDRPSGLLLADSENSQNAVGSISRKWIKQTSIAERCSLQAITEVAREFIADSPSNDYLLAARTARKICIQ
jgi:hypothetical protein